MKQTVVLTAQFPDVALRILGGDFDVIVQSTEGIHDEDEMKEIVADADGLISILTDPVTRGVLAANPNLRIVGNCAVGVDNIDLVAARELGVTVTHTPHVLTDATADLTIALILAATRRLIEGHDLVRRGGFLGWKPLMLLGTNLTGKRLGIIGMGRIGSAVAKRAHALGMEIVYLARSANAEAERTWSARRVDFPELLRTSHVISIHCPLTRDTRHLFDREAIAAMRGDAWLINTARGPIVDEVALADALAEGRIAGAGLDVYEHEPAVEPRLLRMPNVVLLPHIASATVETRSEMARIVAEDVRRVLLGGMPLHPVVL